MTLVADSFTLPPGTTQAGGGIGSPVADLTAPSWGTAQLLASSVSSTGYILAVSAPASDNVGVTRYEYSLDGGASWVPNGLSLSAAVSGRTPGATDACRWRARDAANNSSAALELQVTLALTGPWDAVLNILLATNEESWVQLNATSFADAFVSNDFQPLKAPGVPTARAHMVPWASVALDDERGRIFIWGGGHANSNDNAMYTWEASTRQHRLAFLPTDNVFMPNAVSLYTPQPGLWRNVEPWQHSPASAHTYGNNAFLPLLNRFITFGGAAWNTGHAFHVWETGTGNGVRPLSSYTLDMAQAFTGKVGGTTGSNVQRDSTVGVLLQGANAWAPRDYRLDHPLAGSAVVNTLNGHLEGFAVYRQEAGRDVLYVRSQPGVGQSANRLVRIEYVDHDYRNDIISLVGIEAGGDAYSDQGGAIDPLRGIVMNCGYGIAPLSFWDLANAGPGNVCVTVAPANIAGNGKASYAAAQAAAAGKGMGMLFDTERQRFVMWGGRRALWAAPTPANLLTGWRIDELPVTGPDEPAPGIETGVHGKLKYSAKMDCYLGVSGDAVNIWAYKPANWNPKV